MKAILLVFLTTLSLQVFSQELPTLVYQEEDFTDVDIAKERAKLPWATQDIYANLAKKDIILYENTFMADDMETETFEYEMVIDKTYGKGVLNTSLADLMILKREEDSDISKKFYPFNELELFRVADTAGKISTKAGDFECTVIEAMYDGDQVMLWMINDMPGYYAKILSVEGPEKEGLTIVTELIEL